MEQNGVEIIVNHLQTIVNQDLNSISSSLVNEANKSDLPNFKVEICTKHSSAYSLKNSIDNEIAILNGTYNILNWTIYLFLFDNVLSFLKALNKTDKKFGINDENVLEEVIRQTLPKTIFSFAHEYYHHVQHHTGLLTYPGYNDGQYESRQSEKEANKFAIQFMKARGNFLCNSSIDKYFNK